MKSPRSTRALLQCITCLGVLKVDSAQHFQSCWPRCCGYTMRLLGADEQPKTKESKMTCEHDEHLPPSECPFCNGRYPR